MNSGPGWVPRKLPLWTLNFAVIFTREEAVFFCFGFNHLKRINTHIPHSSIKPGGGNLLAGVPMSYTPCSGEQTWSGSARQAGLGSSFCPPFWGRPVLHAPNLASTRANPLLTVPV